MNESSNLNYEKEDQVSADRDILDELRQWAVKNNICNIEFNKLLGILEKHNLYEPKNLETADIITQNKIENEANTRQILLQILHEVRTIEEKNNKRHEVNQKLIKTLSTEVKALRDEIIQLKSHSKLEPTTSLLPSLPLVTLPAYIEFDKKLSHEDDMRDQLKHFLQRIGGRDLPSFLRMSFKAIMSDDVAVNLTWRGKPEKPSLQRFTSFNIMKEVCLSKYLHATEVDINKTCQQHLLHAKDRLVKRKKANSKAESTNYI